MILDPIKVKLKIAALEAVALPAARPAHIADATNSDDVITRVNAILAALETLGLIASA